MYTHSPAAHGEDPPVPQANRHKDTKQIQESAAMPLDAVSEGFGCAVLVPSPDAMQPIKTSLIKLCIIIKLKIYDTRRLQCGPATGSMGNE